MELFPELAYLFDDGASLSAEETARFARPVHRDMHAMAFMADLESGGRRMFLVRW